MVKGLVAPIDWTLHTPDGPVEVRAGDLIVWDKLWIDVIDEKSILYAGI